jgi:hypothetical protein
MTSPYHASPQAPLVPPPQTAPYVQGGQNPLEQFANTRMTGLFEKLLELEARIVALEIQTAQKV